MDIQKPVLISRLVIGRQLENHRWHRRRLHKCCKAKYKSGKTALRISAAYLNIASRSSLQLGNKQSAYFSPRFHSSKTHNSNAKKKEMSTSLAALYHAAGSFSNSVQRKILDGVFTPILVYSYQMIPKLSSSDHKVLSEKREQNERIEVKQMQSKNNIDDHTEDCSLPHFTTPGKDKEQGLGEKNAGEFQGSKIEKKTATYWVEIPSLKKYASVAALVEKGLSATRVLHRKKLADAVASEEQYSKDACPTNPKIDAELYYSKLQSPNRSESKSNIIDPKQFERNKHSDLIKSTSDMHENMPTAAELLPKYIPPSSSSAYNIFKKLGFTSSSSAADSALSKDKVLQKGTYIGSVHTSNGAISKTSIDYKASSYSSNGASARDVKPVDTNTTTKPKEGSESYIYNNYNLKYIQVNLFPTSFLPRLRKDKPVKSLPTSSENTAYFDSDIPLLEMTDALNSKDTSGVANGSTPAAVADRSKKYAAVADKIKEESVRLKAAEADKSAKKMAKPVISKANIDARTKSLVLGITTATPNASRLLKLERLCNHLVLYPESRQAAIQERLIPTLLKIKQKSKDTTQLAQIHQLLAQLGYAPPVRNRGVRILSVDGGGSRGIIAIEMLRELVRQSGKPVHEMFDYIIGVSSGAVLVYLLAYAKASLDVCEQLFKEFSVEVFNRNTLLGTSKLFFSHAFYDTDAWMRILRSHMQGVGTNPAIEMARDPKCPKVAAVATLMNAGPIKNYLFRNYNPPPNTRAFYQGSSKYQLCEALRASSAAPGYFEEYKLDDYVFQDGGVLTNNPSALALHESKLLWPDTPIQCLVSLGTGRYDPMEEGLESPEYSSLKKKLYQIMISATDTESVHMTLQDVLPAGSYFRFNPLMTEDFLLDENRPEKLDQLQQEALDFVSINELRIMQAAGVLTREKSSLHKAMDWAKLQKDMYR